VSDHLADGDLDRVEVLLGRVPRGAFRVVVRSPDGDPVVIRNAPLLDDGTPMPTRYWLVDESLRAAIGRLEAAGGVRRAEAEVDPSALAAAHDQYRHERDAALPSGHVGPRPSGGVGGTRRGVKCLHAHYAWYLAGGPDPVGEWVDAHLPSPLGSPGAPAALIPDQPPPADARRRIDNESAPSGAAGDDPREPGS
jgi:uncharacterized protein